MKTATTFILMLIVLGAACLAVSALEIGDVSVHGTLSQGYIYSSDNNYIEDSSDGTFDFREYGLNASYTLGEKATFAGQVFGRKFGSIGKDEIYLDWLVAEYAWRDWLTFRAGKLRVPYGFYGETRDVDSLRTGVLLPQGVYPEFVRGFYNATWSGGFSGYAPMKKMGGLSYSFQGGVGYIDKDNGEMTRLFAGRDMSVDDIDADPAAAAALTWHTPVDGLRVGTTWSWSEYTLSGKANSPFGQTSFNADVKDGLLAVGSAEYMRGRLTLSTEYMNQSRTIVYKMVTPQPMPDKTQDVDYWGCYFKGDYRFADWFVLGGGFSHATYRQKMDTGSPQGVQSIKEHQDDWFLSSRFDITQNLIFKVEQHFIAGTLGLFDYLNPDGVKDDWTMTLVKVSFVF